MPQSLRTSEDGQVLIEYVLMLSLSVALLIGIQSSFRNSVFKVWKQFAIEISAACPKNCVKSSSIP
jgi:Flp pilus assembly pilin Flp